MGWVGEESEKVFEDRYEVDGSKRKNGARGNVLARRKKKTAMTE